MRKNVLVIGVAALLAGMISAPAGLAQDFQRTYKIPQDGRIRVSTVSGNVTVQGYDGTEIEVTGTKVGRDRTRVEIVDQSTADSIYLGVRYPEHGSSDASVNFQVRVPRSVSYNFDEIRSISGSVRLADVSGHVRARSISGSVEVKDISGIVSASSTSGNVDVFLRRVEGVGDMEFSSISGNVTVRAPASLDAYVSMSTISGTLGTDFPIEIQERRYLPGRSARGRLGAGSCNIRITSVSGRVSLMKN